MQSFFIVWPPKGERFTSSNKPGESKYFNNKKKLFFSLLKQKISWRLYFWIFNFLSGFCHFLTQKWQDFKNLIFWNSEDQNFKKEMEYQNSSCYKITLLLKFVIGQKIMSYEFFYDRDVSVKHSYCIFAMKIFELIEV